MIHRMLLLLLLLLLLSLGCTRSSSKEELSGSEEVLSGSKEGPSDSKEALLGVWVQRDSQHKPLHALKMSEGTLIIYNSKSGPVWNTKDIPVQIDGVKFWPGKWLNADLVDGWLLITYRDHPDDKGYTVRQQVKLDASKSKLDVFPAGSLGIPDGEYSRYE